MNAHKAIMSDRVVVVQKESDKDTGPGVAVVNVLVDKTVELIKREFIPYVRVEECILRAELKLEEDVVEGVNLVIAVVADGMIGNDINFVCVELVGVSNCKVLSTLVDEAMAIVEATLLRQ